MFYHCNGHEWALSLCVRRPLEPVCQSPMSSKRNKGWDYLLRYSESLRAWTQSSATSPRGMLFLACSMRVSSIPTTSSRSPPCKCLQNMRSMGHASRGTGRPGQVDGSL